MMEPQRHQEDTTVRIRKLVRESKPGTRIVRLRELAREELERGYSREALLEDFEQVRSWLEAQHDSGDEEDDVVTIMDALTGWCSPQAKL